MDLKLDFGQACQQHIKVKGTDISFGVPCYASLITTPFIVRNRYQYLPDMLGLRNKGVFRAFVKLIL